MASAAWCQSYPELLLLLVVLLWLVLVLPPVLGVLGVPAVPAVLVGGVGVGVELSFRLTSVLLEAEPDFFKSRARLDQQDSENKFAYTALICAKLSWG